MTKRLIADVIAGKPAITAVPETSVRAASKLMAERRIGALLIIEDGRLAGIFTERDALNKVLAGGLDPDQTELRSVMAPRLQTIGANRPLSHALLMMAEGGFRHVPVVDAAGLPIGMVSARDALGADLVELEQDIKLIEALESSIGY